MAVISWAPVSISLKSLLCLREFWITGVAHIIALPIWNYTRMTIKYTYIIYDVYDTYIVIFYFKCVLHWIYIYTKCVIVACIYIYNAYMCSSGTFYLLFRSHVLDLVRLNQSKALSGGCHAMPDMLFYVFSLLVWWSCPVYSYSYNKL